MAEQISGEIEVSRQKPFKVFLPGASGGGRGLTALRDFFSDAFVPSSVSSREGFRKGENLSVRYKNIASHIAENAGVNDVAIAVHSMGGWEFPYVVQALLENDGWKGKKIDVSFVSPVAYGGKGIREVLDVVHNIKVVDAEFAVLEQHMAYPLPEVVYTNSPESLELDGAEKIFVDSPQERAQRRQAFLSWLPAIVPDAQERELVLHSLEDLDQKLIATTEDEAASVEIVEQRGVLLKPLIQKLFEGKHILKEVHEAYLKKYNEAEEYLAPLRQQQLNYALFLVKVGSTVALQGLEEQLAGVLNKAKEKGKEVRVNFVLLENDRMVPLAKIDAIKEKMSAAGISDAIEGFSLAEGMAHSTIGYYPDPLQGVLPQ